MPVSTPPSARGVCPGNGPNHVIVACPRAPGAHAAPTHDANTANPVLMVALHSKPAPMGLPRALPAGCTERAFRSWATGREALEEAGEVGDVEDGWGGALVAVRVGVRGRKPLEEAGEVGGIEDGGGGALVAVGVAGAGDGGAGGGDQGAVLAAEGEGGAARGPGDRADLEGGAFGVLVEEGAVGDAVEVDAAAGGPVFAGGGDEVAARGEGDAVEHGVADVDGAGQVAAGDLVEGEAVVVEAGGGEQGAIGRELEGDDIALVAGEVDEGGRGRGVEDDAAVGAGGGEIAAAC